MSAAHLAAKLAALMANSSSGAALESDDGVNEALFDSAIRGAAVLIAFVAHPRPTMLLTRRTEHLARHAGQVAFPGGRIDDSDSDAIAAALREAEEEVGLTRTTPIIIGETTPYLTGTGYRVTPVVAVIPPDLPLVPHEGEVAAIFEVPVDVVFDPANQSRRTVEWKGRMRRFYEIAGSDEYIWGATAGMIVSLGEKLGLAQNPSALNSGTL